MRYQYSFILNSKIESFEDCPCIGAEGECEVLSTGKYAKFCACIGEDGEQVCNVADGDCPLKLKAGY